MLDASEGINASFVFRFQHFFTFDASRAYWCIIANRFFKLVDASWCIMSVSHRQSCKIPAWLATSTVARGIGSPPPIPPPTPLSSRMFVLDLWPTEPGGPTRKMTRHLRSKGIGANYTHRLSGQINYLFGVKIWNIYRYRHAATSVAVFEWRLLVAFETIDRMYEYRLLVVLVIVAPPRMYRYRYGTCTVAHVRVCIIRCEFPYSYGTLVLVI